jgi:hypothetical protein
MTGFSGRIVWDASKPNGQPRRAGVWLPGGYTLRCGAAEND